jgi:hypothetical protein
MLCNFPQQGIILIILVLEEFAPTKYFRESLDTLNNAKHTDKITIILKNNTGGLLNLGSDLINSIRECSADIHIMVDGYAASTGAFLCMWISLAKDYGHYPNVTFSIKTDETFLTYHRPRDKDGRRIEDMIQGTEEYCSMEKDVINLDKCLYLFFKKNPNLFAVAEGQENIRQSHSELTTLYEESIDIYIPLGRFNSDIL